MTRNTLAALLALVVVVSLGACDDGGQVPPYYSYPYGSYRPRPRCEQFTSCESCTPVIGCGWCSSSDGNRCVGNPDRCGAQSFSFTWDIQGCGMDASDDGPKSAGTDAAAGVDGRAASPLDSGRASDAQH